jgi:hypothetical protein
MPQTTRFFNKSSYFLCHNSLKICSFDAGWGCGWGWGWDEGVRVGVRGVGWVWGVWGEGVSVAGVWMGVDWTLPLLLFIPTPSFLRKRSEDQVPWQKMLRSSRSIRPYLICEVLSENSIRAGLWTNPSPSFLRGSRIIDYSWKKEGKSLL